MKHFPHALQFFPSVFVFLCAVAVSADHGIYVYDLEPGDSAVNTKRLKSYRATWAQFTRSASGLVDSGTTFEEILHISPANIKHTQIIRNGSGAVVTEKREFDTMSLLPLKLERSAKGGPAGSPKHLELLPSSNGWEGNVTLDDEQQVPFNYSTEQQAFDGWVAGLTLAALPLEVGYQAKIPTVVQLQQATYLLRVEVIEKRDYELASDTIVPVWVVDTDWINIADDTMSPGGATNSGGTYLISVAPKKGQPHVIEYANNGAVIRWVP